MKMTKSFIFSLVLFCAMPVFCFAEESFFYKELNALVGYSEREEWVGEKGMGLKNSVGFEWFQKFSDDYGDFMTADLQVRLSYDSSVPSDDAWAIELHNAWVEYKVGLGKNLRAGHFSPSFGLEPSLDTHGTLFQTMAGRDIGFKKDWGVGYRSGLGVYDYELSAQIGSGMGIEQKDGSHLISGRIGTPLNNDIRYGLSALVGEILESKENRTIPKPEIADDAVSKWRVGADAQCAFGSYQFMTEVSLGRNENDDVVGVLLGVDYTIPSRQDVTLQAQGQVWTDDPDESERSQSEIGAGVSWRIDRSWTVRMAVFHDLEDPAGFEDTQTFLQLYYFGG
jgi:hypothetical protein